jgi:hypothetical protein
VPTVDIGGMLEYASHMKQIIAILLLLGSSVATADEFRSYMEYKNQLNYADRIHVLTQHRLHYGITDGNFYFELGGLTHDFESGISSEVGFTFIDKTRWNISMNWEGVKYDDYLDHNLETVVRFYFD